MALRVLEKLLWQKLCKKLFQNPICETARQGNEQLKRMIQETKEVLERSSGQDNGLWGVVGSIALAAIASYCMTQTGGTVHPTTGGGIFQWTWTF